MSGYHGPAMWTKHFLPHSNPASVSNAPRWPLGNGQQPIGLFIPETRLHLRIIFDGPVQLLGHAADQERAGRPVRDVGIANRLLSRAHALEEIAGVTVAAVEVDFVGSKRFA